jgi:hypothetical protein
LTLIDFDREAVKLTEMEVEKSQVEGQGDVDLRCFALLGKACCLTAAPFGVRSKASLSAERPLAPKR